MEIELPRHAKRRMQLCELGCQRQRLVAAGFTPAPGAPMKGAATRFEIPVHEHVE